VVQVEASFSNESCDLAASSAISAGIRRSFFNPGAHPLGAANFLPRSLALAFILAGVVALAPAFVCAQSPLSISPGLLVREVVYNELHDHSTHGYWRYSIEKRIQHETRLEQQIETAAGPVTRLMRTNGLPIDLEKQHAEQARLDNLLTSPGDQARLRKEYDDNEKRIGRILALLPDAFLYDYVDEQNGCHHLRFHPNPNYPARSIESRIFHAMSGEMWIDSRYKHLVRLDGQVQTNVDFGFGILGRLYKGGWFRLQRTQVSPTDWKTERLEVHMIGRALLFKTIARETSESRGGFAPVPAGITLAQAMEMLHPLAAESSGSSSEKTTSTAASKSFFNKR
jgi:hypothetical protein